MKKIILLLIGFMLCFAIYGCSDKKAKSDGEIQVIVVNEFLSEDKVLFDKIIKYSTGDTLIKILQKDKELKLLGEESEYGFYITSICDYKASDYSKAFWNIKINDVDASSGISSLEFKDKDVIKFSLISWE